MSSSEIDTLKNQLEGENTHTHTHTHTLPPINVEPDRGPVPLKAKLSSRTPLSCSAIIGGGGWVKPPLQNRLLICCQLGRKLNLPWLRGLVALLAKLSILANGWEHRFAGPLKTKKGT